MQHFGIAILCVASMWASSLEANTLIQPATLKDIGSRIINGDLAAKGQFAYQAGILGQNSDGGYFCGGSIIGEEWILTAAHCVIGARSADIYTGTVKISDTSKTTTPASGFIVHESYDPLTLNHDIGLIKLGRPLIFDDNTKAVTLSEKELPGDTTVTVSGWGVTSDTAAYVSDVLNYINISTITNTECERIYGTATITPAVVCVAPGNPHTSPCQGDSGAPVVAFNSCNKPFQVAVFSFVNGYGCEYPYPSGNSRITYYRDWIKEKTGI